MGLFLLISEFDDKRSREIFSRFCKNFFSFGLRGAVAEVVFVPLTVTEITGLVSFEVGCSIFDRFG